MSTAPSVTMNYGRYPFKRNSGGLLGLQVQHSLGQLLTYLSTLFAYNWVDPLVENENSLLCLATIYTAIYLKSHFELQG